MIGIVAGRFMATPTARSPSELRRGVAPVRPLLGLSPPSLSLSALFGPPPGRWGWYSRAGAAAEAAPRASPPEPAAVLSSSGVAGCDGDTCLGGRGGKGEEGLSGDPELPPPASVDSFAGESAPPLPTNTTGRGVRCGARCAGALLSGVPSPAAAAGASLAPPRAGSAVATEPSAASETAGSPLSRTGGAAAADERDPSLSAGCWLTSRGLPGGDATTCINRACTCSCKRACSAGVSGGGWGPMAPERHSSSCLRRMLTRVPRRLRVGRELVVDPGRDPKPDALWLRLARLLMLLRLPGRLSVDVSVPEPGSSTVGAGLTGVRVAVGDRPAKAGEVTPPTVLAPSASSTCMEAACLGDGSADAVGVTPAPTPPPSPTMLACCIVFAPPMPTRAGVTGPDSTSRTIATSSDGRSDPR